MQLERLFPAGDPADPLRLLAATRPWERAGDGRPLVLGNMVSTLDGRIELGGGSTGLGGPGDKAMFHALRTVVDAVLAGTGTVAAETYGRLVRLPERREARAALGLEPDPTMVLLTRSGAVPWTAPLFAAPEQRVIVASGPAGVAVPVHVLAQVQVIALEDPTPRAALEVLRRSHGLRTVLCEGGPTLLRALVVDDALDELFLTLSPLLVGGEGTVPRVLAGGPLAAPERLELRWVLRDEHELLLRYALQPRDAL